MYAVLGAACDEPEQVPAVLVNDNDADAEAECIAKPVDEKIRLQMYVLNFLNNSLI